MPVSSATVLPNCKTSAVSHGADPGVCNERKMSPKGKNHCKWLKIIGNDQKSSQMSGNDW
jgi:hypothetical protein